MIAFDNRSDLPCAMHLHGHHVREPSGLGRDTVFVAEAASFEVAFVADNPGDWMIHCHMLEHQASGMASWFRVI